MGGPGKPAQPYGYVYVQHLSVLAELTWYADDRALTSLTAAACMRHISFLGTWQLAPALPLRLGHHEPMLAAHRQHNQPSIYCSLSL